MWILTYCMLICNVLCVFAVDNRVRRSMTRAKIIPEIIPGSPRYVMRVFYEDSNEYAKLGNELLPRTTCKKPEVNWPVEDIDDYFTLVMIDPDYPSRVMPTENAWQHWLVVNISARNLNGGTTLSEYVGPKPPFKMGLHRIIFLVYKQTAEMKFKEKFLTKTSDRDRYRFSIAEFVNKYNFGYPYAGNFFLSQFDPYVKTINKQLGI